MKETSDKLNFIKIKNLCSAKDNINRIRRQATDLEKSFAIDTSTIIIQNMQRTFRTQQ